MKLQKELTKLQDKIFKGFATMFLRRKECPSNRELAKKLHVNEETIRSNLWKLVKMNMIGVNKKLKSRKFFYE